MPSADAAAARLRAAGRAGDAAAPHAAVHSKYSIARRGAMAAGAPLTLTLTLALPLSPSLTRCGGCWGAWASRVDLSRLPMPTSSQQSSGAAQRGSSRQRA